MDDPSFLPSSVGSFMWHDVHLPVPRMAGTELFSS